VGSVPPITYYALDLEQRELVRTLNQIILDCPNDSQQKVSRDSHGALGAVLAGKVAARGMWGTYEGGMVLSTLFVWYLCVCFRPIGIQFIKQGGLDKLRTADEAGNSQSDDRGRKMEHMNMSFVDTSPDSGGSASNSESPSRGTETTAPSPPMSALDPNPGVKAQSDTPPIHMLFLGSSLGNFSRPDMASFLSRLPLRPGSGDTLLLGLDGDNDKQLVERAYNDRKGITKAFIMNGLRGSEAVPFCVFASQHTITGASKVLGDESLFVENNWEYVSWYNQEKRRSQDRSVSIISTTGLRCIQVVMRHITSLLDPKL
jgi:L-histidine Nalpha-methyltransferase / hercynylcysteine S-oxide synthase